MSVLEPTPGGQNPSSPGGVLEPSRNRVLEPPAAATAETPGKVLEPAAAKPEEPFYGSAFAYLDAVWQKLDAVERAADTSVVFGSKAGDVKALTPHPGLALVAHTGKVMLDEFEGAAKNIRYPLRTAGKQLGDIFPSIGEQAVGAGRYAKEGFKQQFAGKTDEHGALTNFALGSGKEALGALGIFYSPIGGTVDAVLGKPEAEMLKRDVPEEYPRTIAQLLAPGGYSDAAKAAFLALPAEAKVKLLGEGWEEVFNPHLNTPEGDSAGQAIRHEHAIKNIREENVQKRVTDTLKEAALHRAGEHVEQHGLIGGIARTLVDRRAMADFMVGYLGDAMSLAPDKVRLMFIHAMETGKMRYIPERFRPLAVVLSDVFEQNRKLVQDLNVDERVNWIEHYFPHLWKDPEEAAKFAKQYIQQTMAIEGRKGFLKDRHFDMFREGLEAGLEPVSTNPVLITFIRNREVLRYVMAQKLLRSLNDRSLVKWVERGDKPPEGFVELDDKIAKARFKDINPAYVTLHTMKDEEGENYRFTTSDEVLNEWQQRHPENRIYHAVVKREDLEKRSIDEINTPAFKVKPTLHEHTKHEYLLPKADMDEQVKFGIKTSGEAGEGKWMIHPDADKLMRRYFMPGLFERKGILGSTARGLRFVSNLYNQAQLGLSLFHLGFVSFDSMYSNLALTAKMMSEHRYGKAWSVFKETPVIPVTQAFRGHGLQKAFDDAMIDSVDAGSEVSSLIGGFVKGSRFNKEREFQRHVKNETTRDASVSALADLQEQARQEAVIRREIDPRDEESYVPTDAELARSLQKNWERLSNKTRAHLEKMAKPGENVINTLRADADEATHRAAYKGDLSPNKPGDQADLLEAAISAGAMAKRPKVYSSRLDMPWQEEYRMALQHSGLGSVMSRIAKQGGHVFKGTLGAIGSAEDSLMAPLFQHYVPNMKLGVLVTHAKAWLEKHPQATYEEMSSEMGKIWDSVENRLGEMDLDRRFWNQTVKDTAVIGLRAVGWNYGTLHEIGGGMLDIVGTEAQRMKAAVTKGDMTALFDKGRMTYRASYVFALAAGTAMLGSMLTYLYTGEGPKELKDYFFPPDGQGGRIAPPTYAKEVYEAYYHPVDTIFSKFGPLWSNLYDTLVTNRDFYGAQVWPYMKPFKDKAESTIKFWRDEFMPFSYQSYARTTPYDKSNQSPLVYGLSELTSRSNFGFTKAPAWIERGDALENAIKQKKQLRDLGRAVQGGRIDMDDEDDDGN